MDDHKLPLDLTIYGAIHQHEMRKHRASGSPFVPSMIWQGVYSIKFKKVPGPLPSSDSMSTLTSALSCSHYASRLLEARGDETGSRSRSPSPSLSSLPEDAPHAKILRVLRVLHKLNAQESERATFATAKRILPPSAFVNNKLTAKLTRQLEEPMIVARYDSVIAIPSVTLMFVLLQALACPTGPLTYRSTSPSFSHSPPVITSFSRRLLAMLDSSSNGRASSRIADKTIRDGTMVLVSWVACSDRRFGSRGSTS